MEKRSFIFSHTIRSSKSEHWVRRGWEVMVGTTRFTNVFVFGLVMQLALFFAWNSYGHGGSVFPDKSNSRSGPRTFPKPDPGTFVNFETAQVNPIALSPDGSTIAVCNTPDSHVEIYSVVGNGLLTSEASIPVGYDPVSVRFRTNTEVWVVNHVSDSVSVVNLTSKRVTATINTADEPTDVVFYQDSVIATNLAAVSCSQPDLIQTYNALTHAFVDEVKVLGQDPRALVTDGTNVYAAIFQSGNGTTAIRRNSAHLSGANPYSGAPSDGQYFNNGIPGTGWVTPEGTKTPFQLGVEGKPTPPSIGHIFRKDFSDSGKWKDDNGADWSFFISGAGAAWTGRPVGWDVSDHDIVCIRTGNGSTFVDTTFGDNGYVDFGTTINGAGRRMNIGMALGINPSDGSLMLVGTDATNEIRFEPVLTGTFVRVMAGIATSTGAESAFVDFNELHLANAQGGGAYMDGSVAQSERNKSIGNPRSVAFDPTGARAYVTGKGSGNIVVLDGATGLRLGGNSHAIDLGQNISSPTTGPTGAIHHGTLDRLYVVNRFESTVVVIDTTTVGSETILQTKSMFDPTPDFINLGRIQFYDSHRTSGLGQIACASCHIDGRMDQLAWDLGNPFGEMKTTNQVDVNTPLAGQHNMFLADAAGNVSPPNEFDDFHFMKGPMTTQTLQDIIGKEPLHWRGDKDGIEEFAGAFEGLQGRDAPLEAVPMQEFEDFLGSIHFMPNPFRAVDNSLPGGPQLVGGGTNPLLSLDGFHSNGPAGDNVTLSPRGTQLPDGNAFNGFKLYVEGNPLHTGAHLKAPESLDNVFQCVTCHTLPTGAGSVDLYDTSNGMFVDIAPGPLGESHQAIISVDGTGEKAFKTAPLRNQIDKQGFNIKPNPLDGGNPHNSTHGFGLLHDGGVDNLDTFLGSSAFDIDSDQELADIVAFNLCINGDGFSDLAGQIGAPNFFSPLTITGGVGQLGPDGGDTQTGHAAVGKQVTIVSGTPSASDLTFINTLVTLAENSKIDLIVNGVKDGNNRGWYLTPDVRRAAGDNFVSDINAETNTLSELLGFAGPSTPMTFMGVPEGLGLRMGVDRDEDTFFNHTEVINGTDPADPLSSGMPMRNGGATNYLLMFALFTLLASAYIIVLFRKRRVTR
jgi:YVTN family beta-propeller protein